MNKEKVNVSHANLVRSLLMELKNVNSVQKGLSIIKKKLNHVSNVSQVNSKTRKGRLHAIPALLDSILQRVKRNVLYANKDIIPYLVKSSVQNAVKVNLMIKLVNRPVRTVMLVIINNIKDNLNVIHVNWESSKMKLEKLNVKSVNQELSII